MSKLSKLLRVRPGSKFSLHKVDAGATHGFSKDEADELVFKNSEKLYELQSLMAADRRHSLLVVLQAMDAGGKDGTIRHVMRGLNPQGVSVTPFKVPSTVEREHDFLWRIHPCAPRLGEISIFNRSHYEDVLVVRVHKLIPPKVWKSRYHRINEFERLLADNQTTIVKFFLHISRDEQKQRLEARLTDAAKNWKFSEADMHERVLWDDYQEAYQDAVRHCSTDYAPWFVIPANKKWFRNLAISQILVDTLSGLDMKYPKPALDLTKVRIPD